mgnify:CR=1 FL=1
MKRRLVSLLCITAMTAAMLSGCGDSPAKESTSVEEAKEPEDFSHRRTPSTPKT